MGENRSEQSIQKEILRVIGARPDVRLWRQNTGVARDPSGRVVRFGLPGQADITGLLVGSGRRVELEVKSQTGRSSAKQVQFGAAVTRAGGLYAVVRSVAEAEAVIDEASGVRRCACGAMLSVGNRRCFECGVSRDA